jgi:predicted nucleotidyltransferase
MDTVDIVACRERLDRKRASDRAACAERWERANADARRLIDFIASRYKPERILQWGSVLHPEKFGLRSDIDLAIEGEFDPETWYRLLGEVMNMTSFPLDIVDLKRIEPEFSAIIRLKGRVVYERCSTAD